MRYTSTEILFDEEERYISGLPETMSIALMGTALGHAMAAKAHCLKRYNYLMTCDPLEITDTDVSSLIFFDDRLEKLDRLGGKLIDLVAPHLIDALEKQLPRL